MFYFQIMENLRNVMRCLDDISKMIPEGTYLEMCDNLKEVHSNLPQNEDPPVTDNRQPIPLNVPFQVVILSGPRFLLNGNGYIIIEP